MAGLLGHSGESHKDIAISNTQWVWQEVYKVYSLRLADNGIWEEEKSQGRQYSTVERHIQPSYWENQIKIWLT